jgi:hypothetical protein
VIGLEVLSIGLGLITLGVFVVKRNIRNVGRTEFIDELLIGPPNKKGLNDFYWCASHGWSFRELELYPSCLQRARVMSDRTCAASNQWGAINFSSDVVLSVEPRDVSLGYGGA